MENLLRACLGNVAAATLLAVIAAGAGRCLRQYPALRHCLWLLVLIKLVTPPLWTIPVAWIPASQPDPSVRLASEIVDAPLEGEWQASLVPGSDRLVFIDRAESMPLVQDIPLEPLIAETYLQQSAPPAVSSEQPWSVPWASIIVFAWLSGAGLTFAISGARILRFQRLLRGAIPASDLVIEQVEELSGMLGLRRLPRVCWMPGAVSPMVWAVGTRPRLILPEGLWDRLDKPQRATLLAHELAHLRRGDHWVRCLELLVTGLYWWLPVVWWTRNALREAEEQCCDAWVVWAFPAQARKYAEALLETLDFLSPAAPAAAMSASGLGHVRQLRRRLTMIMHGKTPRSLHWSGALLALGLSATLLPMAPTWAQAPKPAPEVGTSDNRIDLKVDVVTKTEADTLLPPEGFGPFLHDVGDRVNLYVGDNDSFVQIEDLKQKQVDGAITLVTERIENAANPTDSPKEKQSVDAAAQPIEAKLAIDSAQRSAKEALIAQLKERIKATKDKVSGDKNKQEIEALLQQLEAVVKTDKNIVIIRTDVLSRESSDAPGLEQRIKDLSAERKAHVEKVSAEVKALKAKIDAKGAEMREISSKLREAQSRLAKLLAEAQHSQAIRYRVMTRDFKPAEVEILKRSDAKVVREPIEKVRERVIAVREPVRSRTSAGTPGNSDQDRRLSELEKKLDRIADELAKLKKSKD